MNILESLKSFYYIIPVFVLFFIAKVLLSSSVFLEKNKPKKLLTNSEYKFFFVLKKALPEYTIFVQVGFAAMLQAKQRASINRFLAKRADYVICDEKVNVLLIIELDGLSHRGRQVQDRKRDKLLTDAGYKVLHVTKISSIEETRDLIIKTINTNPLEKIKP